MTEFVFYRRQGRLSGFHLSGHATANAGDETGRTVCIGISSAAYMAANTITDVLHIPADVSDGDAEMLVSLRELTPGTDVVLEGLLLHIEQLSQQYPDHLKFSVLEAD